MIHFRHNKLQATLWSEITENFDEDAVKSMLEPIFIAFVGLSVKQYQGNLLLLYYEK